MNDFVSSKAMSKEEFREIAHSGGQVVIRIGPDPQGRRGYQQTWIHQRPVASAIFAIYAQGVPVCGLPSVAAPNNRLVRIVGIHVQPTATEDLRENVARRGNTLTCGASDTDCEGLPHSYSPSESPGEPPASALRCDRGPRSALIMLGVAAQSSTFPTALDKLK